MRLLSSLFHMPLSTQKILGHHNKIQIFSYKYFCKTGKTLQVEQPIGMMKDILFILDLFSFHTKSYRLSHCRSLYFCRFLFSSFHDNLSHTPHKHTIITLPSTYVKPAWHRYTRIGTYTGTHRVFLFPIFFLPSHTMK